MTLVSFVNQALVLLTIAGHIIVALLIMVFLMRRTDILRWVGKRVLVVAFIVALIATLGSLFYSEVVGYEPCKLCWFQRIFMYPQVILLGVALWKNDRGIIPYALILSLLGAIIAGYHYLLQVGVASELPCSAVGYSLACSQRFVMEWGYITIPLMALTAFIMISLFFALPRMAERKLRQTLSLRSRRGGI